MLGVAAPISTLLGQTVTGTVTGATAVPSVGAAGGHLAVDLLALGALVALAHLRGRAAGGLGFALVVLNLGLFATLVAITGQAFTAGAGFGLFGILSLIRLRSASFTTPDMAYTFLAVVLGLVTGLVALPLWLTVGAAGLLAVLPAFADRAEPVAAEPEPLPEKVPAPPTRKIDVVLDGAFGTADAARAEVERRLGVVALDVVLDEVDYVREVTKVRVTVPAPEQAPVPSPGYAPLQGHAPGVPAVAARPGVVAGPWSTSGQRLPHQLPPPSGADLGPGVPLSPDVAQHPATGYAASAGYPADGAEPGRRARRLRSADGADPGESGRLPRLLGPAGR